MQPLLAAWFDGEGKPATASYLILLLMLQDSLEESSPFMAGGLLVKHASLDHLLVYVQLVLGCCEDLLFHTVHSAEAQHADLILLPNTVCSVLCLQVLEGEEEDPFTVQKVI